MAELDFPAPQRRRRQRRAGLVWPPRAAQLRLAPHLIARTCIAGHRGAAALVEHENTLDAFLKTAEVGAGWVELDVRRLRDGTLAVLHDPTLDGRPVGQLTLSEVRCITEALGYEAPTLAQALTTAQGRFAVDIELKERHTEADAVAIARELLPADQVVFTSFEDEVVAGCKRLYPQARAGLLLGLAAPQSARTRLSELWPVKRLRACNADFAAPNIQLLRVGLQARLRKAGFPIWVWTVNDPATLTKLLEAGVQGIITDYPDIAVQLRDAIQPTQT